MRVNVRTKTGHLVLAKARQMNELIDLQGIFKDYWNSDKRLFTLQCQS